MPTHTLPKKLTFRPGIWRSFLALAGGSAGGLAYPNINLWPAIFLSLTLVFLAIHNVGFWRGFRLGFLAGFCFYLSGIYWLSLYLGPEPLIALSLLEALIYAFGTALTALVWRYLKGGSAFKVLLQATSLAVLFTAREWVSTHIPYGGFPWMRVSQALAGTWLSKWVFLFGISGLSLLAAFVAAVLALTIIHRNKLRAVPQVCIAPLATVVVFAVVPLLINPPATAEAGTLRVAGIQGNANAGLFSNEQWGSILRNHLRQTERLLKTPDGKSAQLVIWPENAADISPLDYPQAAAQIQNLVQDMNKPLIFGTTRSVGEKIFNSSVLWMPNTGPFAIYDKKRPVPFAEYVPDRPFWFALAPSLIGLISHGFSAGTQSGVFHLREKRLGVLICFEIAIDEINRELVSQGAQVIVSQTNNADFGRSAETYQQASLAKLQAIATGRAVVNISTVGVSAIFLPDGSVTHQLPVFKPASLVATVPLRTSLTPAQILGVYLELIDNLFALILCLLALPRMFGNRRVRDA